MLNSVNQIRVELQEIASAHLQINDFFWGDFLRAYKENTELNYPLMGCFYPSASLLNNQTQLALTIYICDRVYKDYSNLNDVESDTLQICRDIYQVINGSQRWRRLGRVTSASATKFIERGGDEVAGHTLTINFLLRDQSGICDLPMEGYDFDQNVSPAPTCEPVEYTITDTELNVIYSGEVASGGTLNQVISDSIAYLEDTAGNPIITTNILAEGSATITAPDAALHIKAENDGTITNLLLLSNSANEYTVANNDILVNGNLEFDIHATNSLDIRLRDQSNNVLTPTGIQHAGDHVKIELNVTTPVSGATLMKSGQIVSYRFGDDGKIKAGRAVDFTLLSVNNPFGNSNRFTDTLGGQTYSDNIVIDWSTFNGSTVLGWRRTKSTGYTDWNTAIDNALALSIGGFATGWRLPNRGELFSILNHGVATSVLNFAPFSITADTNIWTGTTNHIVTANAFVLASTGNGSMGAFNKTSAAAEYIPCRTFTVTGTTLS
jgi:hypothetical protein